MMTSFPGIWKAPSLWRKCTDHHFVCFCYEWLFVTFVNRLFLLKPGSPGCLTCSQLQ